MTKIDTSTEAVERLLEDVTPGPGVRALVELAEELITAVWHLMDNSEESGPIEDPKITVWKPDFDEVSAILDRIEGLPSGSIEHMTAGELFAANILVALRALTTDQERDALAKVRAEAALAAQINTVPFRTGLFDKDGREICLGDRLRHLNASPLTKQEYWFPEYEVIWDAPSFRLKHTGGGKPSDTMFAFKHYSIGFETITAQPHDRSALDRIIAVTRAEAMHEAVDAVEDYCSDMPDLAGHGHSVGLRDAILSRADEIEKGDV